MDWLVDIGLGGVFGALAAVWMSGRRLAGEIGEVRAHIEGAIRDPRSLNVEALLQDLRELEAEARSFWGGLKRLFRIG